MIRKLRNEYKVESKKIVWSGVFENFVYGFLGSIIVVFITEGIDMAVMVSYLVYYFFLGKVINRPKYVTSLGKFIIFPIPTALGAYGGYKFAGLLSFLLA